MANTVSTISYANTFGQWMVATDALIAENNILATGDYTKTSGTIYLSETTKNALQANGSVIVQKQLLVQGVASSATIDNNLTVAGQIYFSNTTLGLTNSGQANINGLLIAQGSGIGLSVANNAFIGGNTTIRYNTITNNVQANSTVNTANASITGTVYTNNLTANARIMGAVASITGSTYTNILQANTSVLTGELQANTSVLTNVLQAITSVNTAIISVTNNVIAKDIQANNVISTPSLLSNTITANISATIPTLTVNTKLDGNNAAAFVNSLQVQGGGLTVNGNFTLTGTTVYASNTFQLSTGVTSGVTSYIQVARGTSGANGALRWNEPSLYWETLDVTGNIYSRIITENYLANQTGSSANSAFLKANSAYDSQNVTGTYANSAYTQANSAYAQANSASLYANGAFIQSNAAFLVANTPTHVANSAASYANTAFLKANASYALANTFANTFVGTSGSISQSAGVISLSSNNGLTIVATSANNLAVSTSQDLRTSASPTFAGLTLTTPLALSQGGTGTTSAASALTNLLPTGTTAGYVLTTGGPGNFYWSAASGGGGGVTPGTSINSTRLSYTANGASGYTGNSFIIPAATAGTQVRAYINGVRQFESEYALNLSANTIAFTTTPPNGDAVLIEVDGYYVNPYYANNIAFTINSNISATANTIQLAIDALTSKVTTYYANTNIASGPQAFGNVVTGITVAAGTSNTAFATTAYVQNAANNIPTAVYTSGSYANPSWITTLSADKVGLGTTANAQFLSLGIGTAASGTTGDIRATNEITAYYSDDNLKNRLGTIDNALDKLCTLTGFYYEANETAQALGYKVKREVGVSAQEVQKVMPEIVVPAPIDDKYLTIHYERLIPLLIESIKELKNEVDVLKGQIK